MKNLAKAILQPVKIEYEDLPSLSILTSDLFASIRYIIPFNFKTRSWGTSTKPLIVILSRLSVTLIGELFEILEKSTEIGVFRSPCDSVSVFVHPLGVLQSRSVGYYIDSPTTNTKRRTFYTRCFLTIKC